MDTSPNHLQAWNLDNGLCHRTHSFRLYLGSPLQYVEIPFLAHLSFIRSQPHKYTTYGIVQSNTQSDDENDSEEALPRSALNAPIEALQGLANAAVEAANAPELSPGCVDVYVLSTSRLSQLQQDAQEEEG